MGYLAGPLRITLKPPETQTQRLQVCLQKSIKILEKVKHTKGLKPLAPFEWAGSQA